MKENILEIKKLIPSKICQKIIHYFDDNYYDAGVGVGNVDKEIRNCVTRSILKTKSFGEKIVSNYVKNKLQTCAEHYKKQHGNFHYSKISQLDILKYDSNNYKAGYTFHVDVGDKCAERHISISICLNNDFDGGEFVFDLPGEKYQVGQNIGDALIFPSNFLFPHQVNQITRGTRYALIGWII